MVMPATPTSPSAVLTSSTLFGRMMLLTSFMRSSALRQQSLVFRVGKHAELRHVESFHLGLGTHTHAPDRIHDLEHDEREAEGVDRAQRRTAKLQQELR